MDYEANLLSGAGGLYSAIDSKLTFLGAGISPEELARRATFAGSCIGCHEPALMGSLDLGGGITAPSSLGFVHVSETGRETCTTFNDCWQISPALDGEFLPHRETTMISYLTDTYCSSCSSTSSATALNVSAGTKPEPLGVRVPSVDDSADIDELLAYEQALEDQQSRVTISGAPVSRMH